MLQSALSNESISRYRSGMYNFIIKQENELKTFRKKTRLSKILDFALAIFKNRNTQLLSGLVVEELPCDR